MAKKTKTVTKTKTTPEEMPTEVAEASVPAEVPQTHREAKEANKDRPDCRRCLHYMYLGRSGLTSSVTEDLVKITKNWMETFCGKKPTDEKGRVINEALDCRGKSFTPYKA